jgi:hypothetical protein
MACTTHVKVAVPSVDGATIHCKRKIWIAVCSRPLCYAAPPTCDSSDHRACLLLLTRTGNTDSRLVFAVAVILTLRLLRFCWSSRLQTPTLRRSIAAVERLKDSNNVHEANRSVIKSQKKERGTEYLCESAVNLFFALLIVSMLSSRAFLQM